MAALAEALLRWPPNNRMQATAGGATVLSSLVEPSPASPDAERYAHLRVTT
jgi:hypothetical protein